MRRMVVAVPLAALTLLAWSALPLQAQDTKTARGTVAAVAGNTLTVKTADAELQFVVDQATTITASGAGTAARQAAAAGKAGPTLAEVIKVGQAVHVVYRESGGTLHAERVRRVASAGRGATGDDDDEDTATGTVETVTTDSLTIKGSSGGGATFSQTFAVDTDTKVVAVGASTAAAGGAKMITDFVGPGDRVTVWYSKKGDRLVASELRVRSKAK